MILRPPGKVIDGVAASFFPPALMKALQHPEHQAEKMLIKSCF